jgi:hypothetical protein
MWEPRPLTRLWAVTACYRDNLTLPNVVVCYNASLKRILTWSDHSSQIFGNVPEIRPLARNDFVPDLINKLMQFEERETEVAQSLSDGLGRSWFRLITKEQNREILGNLRAVYEAVKAGIVGSNPTQGMDVCVRLFCVCVVLCIGSGLATGWSPVQGVLPTVYRIKKLKKLPRPNKGL